MDIGLLGLLESARLCFRIVTTGNGRKGRKLHLARVGIGEE